MFLLIPIATIAYLIGGYFVILTPGNLYNAIVSENWVMFRVDLTNFVIIASIVILVKVIRGILRESAANCLRVRLTGLLHRRYFGTALYQPPYNPPPYYRIVAEEIVDNPDQRIVADVREFSISFFDILAGGRAQGSDSGGLLESAMSILFYSQRTLARTGWYGVAVAYLWSLIVSLVAIFVINRTSPAVFRQEQLEANFRYAHADLRRHAEEVAFLRGASFELGKLTKCLNRVISNTWVVIVRHIFLNFVQYGFQYYVSIVMYLTLALAIQGNMFEGGGYTFSSEMTPGEKAQWISQTGGIFLQLLFSFTMLIQLGTSLSVFVSNSERVMALLNALESANDDEALDTNTSDTEPLIASENGSSNSRLYWADDDGIRVVNLVLQLSDVTTIGPVSFSITKGEWVLIESPTGSGKTSILRALRGLWKASSGSVNMPSDENAVAFAPQVPYISPGFHTLREVVRYPHTCSHSTTETELIVSALDMVGWRRSAIENIDTREQWSSQLSPGELQLLAAARILVTKPAYAFLDEPTSALDVESEARVFQAFKQAGMTGITVGHSAALRSFHGRVISLEAVRSEETMRKSDMKL